MLVPAGFQIEKADRRAQPAQPDPQLMGAFDRDTGQDRCQVGQYVMQMTGQNAAGGRGGRFVASRCFRHHLDGFGPFAQPARQLQAALVFRWQQQARVVLRCPMADELVELDDRAGLVFQFDFGNAFAAVAGPDHALIAGQLDLQAAGRRHPAGAALEIGFEDRRQQAQGIAHQIADRFARRRQRLAIGFVAGHRLFPLVALERSTAGRFDGLLGTVRRAPDAQTDARVHQIARRRVEIAIQQSAWLCCRRTVGAGRELGQHAVAQGELEFVFGHVRDSFGDEGRSDARQAMIEGRCRQKDDNGMTEPVCHGRYGRGQPVVRFPDATGRVAARSGAAHNRTRARCRAL